MAKRLNPDNEEENEHTKNSFVILEEDERKNRIIVKAKRRLVNRESTGTVPFAAFQGFNWFSNSGNNFTSLKTGNHANIISGVDILKTDDEKKVKGNITMNGEKEEFPFHEFSRSSSSRSRCSFFKADVPEINSSAASTLKMEYEKESESLTMDEEEANTDELKITDVNGDNFRKQLQNLNENVMRMVELYTSENPYTDFSLIFNDYQKNVFETLNLIHHSEANSSTFQEQNNFLPGSTFTKEDLSSNNANDVHHLFNFENNLEKENETDCGMNFGSISANTFPFDFNIQNASNATSLISSELITNITDESVPEKEPVELSSDSNSKKISLEKNSFQLSGQKRTLFYNDYLKCLKTPNLIHHNKDISAYHELKKFLPGSIFTMEDPSSNNAPHRFNFGNSFEKESEIDYGMDIAPNSTNASPFNFRERNTSSTSKLIRNLTGKSVAQKEPVEFSSISNYKEASSLEKESSQLSCGTNIQHGISLHDSTSIKCFPNPFSFLPLPFRAYLFRIFNQENH